MNLELNSGEKQILITALRLLETYSTDSMDDSGNLYVDDELMTWEDLDLHPDYR